MKIKRILATLLVACMIFSILPASVLADDSGRMCFDSNVNVDAGGNVTFDLNVENNPGFDSLSVRIFYKSLTCEWIDCYVDKNDEDTVYGAATKTYAAEIRRNQITTAISSNVNDAANIPNERAEAGWQMASIGIVFQDKDEKYAANPRKLSASGAMASLNFSAPAGMETQDVAIEVEILKATDNNNNVAIGGSTGKIHVNGVAPEIGTIKVTTTVDSEEKEKYTSEYASGETFNLNVTSKQGTPITDLVEFTLTKDGKPYDINNGFLIRDGKLTVNSVDPAPAGTYTITATPKTVDGVAACEGTATATLTITPKKIASPYTMEVTGFVKGKTVSDVTVDATDGLQAQCAWYEGTDDVSDKTPLADTAKFGASKDYTLVLTLSAENNNYELEAGASVTVTGVGESQTGTLDAENKITVTGTTGDKDPTKLKLGTQLYVASSTRITYGMKLNEVPIFTDEAVAVAYVNGQEGEVVTGSYSWATLDAPVGNAGQNRAEAVFTPSEEYADRYVGFTMWLSYYVSPKRITLDDKNVVWSATNLTYNGDEQTVTLTTPGIEGDVDVAYDYEDGHTNKATNVGSYTAAAILTTKNANNVVFASDGSNSYKCTTSWKINKATYNGPLNECTKHAYVSASQRLTLTPADFGMSTADAIYNEITGVSFRYYPSDLEGKLVTSYETVDSAKSLKLDLRAATADEVTRNYTETYYVVFTSPNYNDITVTLKIVASNKETKTGVITITNVSDTYTYGSVVSPDVEGKPEDAGNETFTYYDEQNNVVNVATGTTLPVGKYTVVASCEDNTYIYTASKNFEINPRSISGSTVTFTPSSLVYDNDNHELTMSVTLGGKELTPTTDYTVTFDHAAGVTFVVENQKWRAVFAPGEYEFTVKGTGNYTSEVTATFEVKKAQISSATVTGLDGPFTYSGEAIQPKPTVTFNGITLTEGTDYTLSYSNNIDAGINTATVTITAAENHAHFTGSTTATFTINPLNISPAGVVSAVPGTIDGLIYNAEEQKPIKKVKFDDTELKEGTDYEISYTNNVNAGENTASFIITGKGNFTGEKTGTFSIAKANLNLPSENPAFTYVYTETGTKTYTLPSDMFLANETNKSFTIESVVCTNNTIFTEAPKASTDKTKLEYTLKGDRTLGKAFIQITIGPNSANYKSGLLTVEVEVVDKTDVSKNISFPDGTRTYTGSGIKYEAATINGNSISATYTYTPAPNSTTASLTDSTDPNGAGLPLTVGTYTVTATYSDATSFGSKTATFEIKPATPTTPDPVKVDGPGKKLADLEESMRKDIGLAGQFTWTDANGNSLPSTTEIQPDTEYKWTFTPDNANYSEIKGSFVPYVDDISYLPAVIGGNTGSFNFRDVTRTDYYYNAVKWAAENGIASGTSSRTFSPDAVCTRAQTVTFLWRAAGSPLPRYRVNPFTDVSPYDYYYNAVLWAVEEGITTGLTATTFGPDATVTRGQVATFLYRAASAAKPNTFNPFTDVKSSAYHYDAVLWAYDNSITTGTSTTTFSPDAFCTRAQIVTFLYRFYQGR